jgi:hypothetical protein
MVHVAPRRTEEHVESPVRTRSGVLSWVRANKPALALLLLAPSIPELLTGSTSVTPLFLDPVGFVISFGLDVVLYGFGALLIREFSVAYRKGWGSILLLGAAYGIAEEGFAVHTFFQPSGNPVQALGSYGHLYGVNWLWALVLTVFHATYSIALPILLTYLWFPDAKGSRWLSRRTVAILSVVYGTEVVGFGFLVGHGPSPAALGFFVLVVLGLISLAVSLPRYALAPRPGPCRLRRGALWLLGAGEFAAYVVVLVCSITRVIPAVGAALFFVLANIGILLILHWFVGTENLERSEFRFAVGMLSALFAWDVLVTFLGQPAILGVAAIFAYLLYRLDKTLETRAQGPSPTVPKGVLG